METENKFPIEENDLPIENPIPKGYCATVELKNGLIEEIWYTCYPSIRHILKRIIKIYW